MDESASIGVVVDIDGVLRLGTVSRQWRRVRARLRRSTTDRRSVFGMPHLVRELVRGQHEPVVVYVTAVPEKHRRSLRRMLERDGYPAGRLLAAPDTKAPAWLFGGGFTAKHEALQRVLADRRDVRWVLIGDDAGHDPALFVDLARRAPARIAAFGIRHAADPTDVKTSRTEGFSGIPVVRAPNGVELLPPLREAAGLRQLRGGSPDDWLLTPAERGNDASGLRAFTEGNAVQPLVHGSTYFAALLAACEGLGQGDLLLLLGWRMDSTELLRPGGPTVAQALRSAAQRGAHVRGLLWRSYPAALGFQLGPNRDSARVVNAAGGRILLDQRVRALGSHHQKAVVARYLARPADDVAFLGGIDCAHGHRDDAEHAGDPQPIAASDRYGCTPAQHDVQLKLRGPVVAEVERTFRERWQDPTALTRRPWEWLNDRIHRLPRTVVSLPARSDPAPAAGTCAVQILRTYPRRRTNSFAPHGERSIARAYAKALSRAERLVYIEDQYLWSIDVARLFAAALRRSPRLQLIAVVPRFSDVNDRFSRQAALFGHHEALDMVREAGGSRVQIFDIENHRGLPVYVHAKLSIIDDVWAVVGSANLNMRSWTYDAEIAAAVLDERRDPRAPVDPAGLGDGARHFARELRLQLMREHVETRDDATLLDLDEAAETMRRSAANLDGWYRSDCRGPRPRGRLRAHVPVSGGKNPGWRRWIVEPAYRAVYDPDGRPTLMWLRRSY